MDRMVGEGRVETKLAKAQIQMANPLLRLQEWEVSQANENDVSYFAPGSAQATERATMIFTDGGGKNVAVAAANDTLGTGSDATNAYRTATTR